MQHCRNLNIITYSSVALKLELKTATNIEQHCRNLSYDSVALKSQDKK